MYRRKIQLGGERSDQPAICPLCGNGDHQLCPASFGVPVCFADDLAFGSQVGLPVSRQPDVGDIRRAGGDDVPVEVEDSELLEIAEALVEREQIVAKATLHLSLGHASRCAIK